MGCIIVLYTYSTEVRRGLIQRQDFYNVGSGILVGRQASEGHFRFVVKNLHHIIYYTPNQV